MTLVEKSCDRGRESCDPGREVIRRSGRGREIGKVGERKGEEIIRRSGRGREGGTAQGGNDDY